MTAENGENTAENARKREQLVDQLQSRGALTTERVIDAFRTVPRERFVPAEHRDSAYADNPLPIGEGQTISAPHMVAHMTELLEPAETDKVLEIGAGSGYQAAILSHLVDRIVTVEIKEELAAEATEKLAGYDNVTVLHADGSAGYTPEAPYDKILYTAAAETIPNTVFDQLKPGGILVAPVGTRQQRLKVFYKSEDGDIREETKYSVRFVPLTGEEGVQE